MKELLFPMFPWQGGRVGVVPRAKLTETFDGEQFSRDAALTVLRSVHRDPAAMVVLRQVIRDDQIGERLPGAAGELIAKQIHDRIIRMNDADVVDQIVQGVTMGRLVIIREKRSWRTVPKDVQVVESLPPASQPAERVVNQPPASTKVCCCTNPACAQAFDDAAANGTPMVERGGPNC